MHDPEGSSCQQYAENVLTSQFIDSVTSGTSQTLPPTGVFCLTRAINDGAYLLGGFAWLRRITMAFESYKLLPLIVSSTGEVPAPLTRRRVGLCIHKSSLLTLEKLATPLGK